MPQHRRVTRLPHNPDAIDIAATLRRENAERYAKVQASQPVADPAERRVLVALGTIMFIVVLVAWSVWGR